MLKNSLITLSLVTLFSINVHAQVGNGQLGGFDPSLLSDPALSNRVWMSYSTVDNSVWPADASKPKQRLVSTRLAFSDDYGKTFNDLGLINTAQDLPGGYSSVNEVSSFLYDPADLNSNSRWKIFSDHHYLNSNAIGNNRDYSKAWIAMKGSANPLTGWSSEIKLIAGNLYDPNNSLNPGAPLINPLPAGLTDCLALTEPGTLSLNNALYLALQCQAGTTASQTRVVLTKLSTQLNPAKFEVKAKLFDSADMALVKNKYKNVLPDLNFAISATAPDFYTKNGKQFVILSPIDSSFTYLGCLVFQIKNMETAEIERDATGTPILVSALEGARGSFRGACSYKANSVQSGILISQIIPDLAKPFNFLPSALNP